MPLIRSRWGRSSGAGTSVPRADSCSARAGRNLSIPRVTHTLAIAQEGTATTLRHLAALRGRRCRSHGQWARDQRDLAPVPYPRSSSTLLVIRMGRKRHPPLPASRQLASALPFDQKLQLTYHPAVLVHRSRDRHAHAEQRPVLTLVPGTSGLCWTRVGLANTYPHQLTIWPPQRRMPHGRLPRTRSTMPLRAWRGARAHDW